MERYRNLSGDSGVTAYDLGPDSITVQFGEGDAYLYTNASAGAANIARMQTLAKAGRGLCTFINKAVRDRYARKVG